MATTKAGEPSPQKGAAVEAVSGPSVIAFGSLLPIAAQHVAAPSEDRSTISDVSTATPFAAVQSAGAESGRAEHITAVTDIATSVVPEVDIEGNPHMRGPGTRAQVRR